MKIRKDRLQDDATCLQSGPKGRVGGAWHRLCPSPTDSSRACGDFKEDWQEADSS